MIDKKGLFLAAIVTVRFHFNSEKLPQNIRHLQVNIN